MSTDTDDLKIAMLEDIGDRIIATLRAYLPAKLQALSDYYRAQDIAKFDAPIELPCPRDACFYFGDVDLISEFPACCVDPARTEFVNKRAYRSHGTHPEFNSFIVEWYIVDDSDERTTRKMLRYGLAISEVLQEHSTLDDLVNEGAVGEVAYGRGVEKNGGKLRRVITIPVSYGSLTDAA